MDLPCDTEQVLFVTGLVMMVCQLIIFPPIISAVGIAMWQRIGYILGVLAFIAAPSVQTLSWNDASLYVVSVATNLAINCSLAAVRKPLS